MNLWRLQLPSSIPSPAAVQSGLLLHVQHAPLITIQMRIGTVSQSYLLLHGCDGCALGRCQLGCHTEAIRRILRAGYGPEARLERVISGKLVARPYTQYVGLIPTRQAQPLDTLTLAAFAESRLSFTWQPAPKPLVSGMLALVAPTDHSTLYEQLSQIRLLGWEPQRLPAVTYRLLPPMLATLHRLWQRPTQLMPWLAYTRQIEMEAETV